MWNWVLRSEYLNKLCLSSTNFNVILFILFLIKSFNPEPDLHLHPGVLPRNAAQKAVMVLPSWKNFPYKAIQLRSLPPSIQISKTCFFEFLFAWWSVYCWVINFFPCLMTTTSNPNENISNMLSFSVLALDHHSLASFTNTNTDNIIPFMFYSFGKQFLTC